MQILLLGNYQVVQLNEYVVGLSAIRVGDHDHLPLGEIGWDVLRGQLADILLNI